MFDTKLSHFLRGSKVFNHSSLEKMKDRYWVTISNRIEFIFIASFKNVQQCVCKMALIFVNLFVTAFVQPCGFRLNSNSFNLCKKGPFNRKEMKSLRLKISTERQRTLTLNKTDCFEKLRNSSVVWFCSQNIYMQCWKDKDKTLEIPKGKEGSFLNTKLYCERRGSLKKNLKNKWCHSCIFKSPAFVVYRFCLVPTLLLSIDVWKFQHDLPSIPQMPVFTLPNQQQAWLKKQSTMPTIDIF